MSAEVKCDKCEYVAKSPTGLQIHVFRKHTKRGQMLAKAAAARMNSPAARKKSLATRLSKPVARKIYARRKPARLQRAAISDEVKFCPRCACNLEAVRMALSFAAGDR